MKYISKGPEDTRKIAKEFLDSLKKGEKAVVVALQGDLGSGKTNFTQIVGSIFDIKENMQSPTFVIEKVYEINWNGFEKLIHIDAYRLEKDEELLHLGWEEIISEPENLIFIEWPENVRAIIPEDAKKISLNFVDENTREIEF